MDIMRSLLRLSAVALMGLGFIVATPGDARAKVVEGGWHTQRFHYGHARPPPIYYGAPRYHVPRVFAPPPVYFAPRPRFHGPPAWAYRPHHHGRRW